MKNQERRKVDLVHIDMNDSDNDADTETNDNRDKGLAKFKKTYSDGYEAFAQNWSPAHLPDYGRARNVAKDVHLLAFVNQIQTAYKKHRSRMSASSSNRITLNFDSTVRPERRPRRKTVWELFSENVNCAIMEGKPNAPVRTDVHPQSFHDVHPMSFHAMRRERGLDSSMDFGVYDERLVDVRSKAKDGSTERSRKHKHKHNRKHKKMRAWSTEAQPDDTPTPRPEKKPKKKSSRSRLSQAEVDMLTAAGFRKRQDPAAVQLLPLEIKSPQLDHNTSTPTSTGSIDLTTFEIIMDMSFDGNQVGTVPYQGQTKDLLRLDDLVAIDDRKKATTFQELIPAIAPFQEISPAIAPFQEFSASAAVAPFQEISDSDGIGIFPEISSTIDLTPLKAVLLDNLDEPLATFNSH